jgi:uncharacterized metal-binding protein YceD (DUF177 family)
VSGQLSSGLPASLTRRVVAANLPKAGVTIRLAADAAGCAAVAERLGLAKVETFAADVALQPAGTGRYAAEGEVRARVWQTCVATLEDFPADVVAPVQAAFADDDRLPAPTKKEVERALDDEDPPESLDDGAIDVGALAVEFLALALDPFPRKPGAKFAGGGDAPADESPFAALAALKRSSQ